eukprot:m.104069 g.104069  ORF g.104069 m.104069 type:complete len:376 (-) comp20911_c0_seq1:210-1337(-)
MAVPPARHARPARAPPAGAAIAKVASTDGPGIRAALLRDGVVVCTAAATTPEVDVAKDLFWDFLESQCVGIDRSAPDTIASAAWNQLCFPKNGTFSRAGVGQSDFMWHCRLLPGVRRCFAEAWAEGSAADRPCLDLVTSFDGAGAFRNPWSPGRVDGSGVPDPSWVTEGGWFHTDQSWFDHPGLASYQGVLNLLPATHSTGSTVLVPGSHRYFEEVCRDPDRTIKPVRQGTVSYVKLTLPSDAARWCSGAVQVEMAPGDLLLWDSRTIHCAQGVDLTAGEAAAIPAAVAATASPADTMLARMVAYICMVPRSHLRRAKTSPEIRVEYVRRRMTSGHNPVVTSLGHDPRVTQVGQGGEFKLASAVPPPTDPRWELV